MKYLAKIYWSEADDAYVAEVPALPGCVSHGTSYADAARKIQEAMEVWLRSAKKHGDPIPESDMAREEIRRLSSILNLSKLAKRAGVNRFTLESKLKRGTAFTPMESRKLLRAIQSV